MTNQLANNFQDPGLAGYYVSDGYFKKDEGYDWVAVIVKRVSENELKISVRSRADKKRPSCTFDTSVFRREKNNFSTQIGGNTVLVDFTGDKVIIKGEDQKGESLLYFYCSGGATVGGTYSKIQEEIDVDQMDPTIFHDNLQLQNIGFEISTVLNNDQKILKVTPYGLSETNGGFKTYIEGEVTNAEIEDLNADGFPELLIYTRTPDHKGNVMAYSVNNGKSLSLVYFPDISENKELAGSYGGHDEFSLIERNLGRRFPVYENGEPTGKFKQVIYKMEDGANSRRFVIKEITEY
ncbi:hypothetical protein ML462_08395 [Gramella lutea]|uniref:Uncharacterized protein n=1 Tax=Christiangramia lutea TaxID=1607951 RepID=A0A9X1V5V4_9FLAO|nr:hypothetical protein [Christiangramia lutea]MCH4823193.1 hypothetical protein [Christiangramia lutea]